MESNIIRNYSHTECTVCKHSITPSQANPDKTENYCDICGKKQTVTHYFTAAVKFTLTPIDNGKLGEQIWSDTKDVTIPQGNVHVTVNKVNNEYMFDVPPILYDYVKSYEFQRKPVKSLNGRILITTINDVEFNDVCKILNFKVVLLSKAQTSETLPSQRQFPYQYSTYTNSTCKYCTNIQKLPGDYKREAYNCKTCGSLSDWKHNYQYSSEANIHLQQMILDKNRWFSYDFAVTIITKINNQYVYEFIIQQEFFDLLSEITFDYRVNGSKYHITIQNDDDLLNKILRTLHWKIIFPKDDMDHKITQSIKPFESETILYPLYSDDGITYYGEFGFNNYYQIWYIQGDGIIELLVNYEMKELLAKFHSFTFVVTNNDMYLCSFNKSTLASIGETLNTKFIVSEEYPPKRTNNAKPLQVVHLESGPLNNGDYVGSWFDDDLPSTQPFMNRIVRYNNGDVAKPRWRIWIVNPVLPKIKDLLISIGENMNPKKRTYFTSASSWNTNDSIVEITFTDEFPIDKIWDALSINPTINHHE